ncbi:MULTISPECIES: hypothetical protein [unclassified Microcoleus]|uniref:hypothetical protein n=1 Tax=unclassified Microcoleus TaxID=2642155 RepID=UPI0025E989F1|nr:MULTISPECIES: hypothetical protein [unclassified Microcoleus]
MEPDESLERDEALEPDWTIADWASGLDRTLGFDWAIAACASGLDWTLAAVASGLDRTLGFDWAASAVYLHYSVVVSNSHDQFIIGGRPNDKAVDLVRSRKFHLAVRLIESSNNYKGFRIALS